MTCQAYHTNSSQLVPPSRICILNHTQGYHEAPAMKTLGCGVAVVESVILAYGPCCVAMNGGVGGEKAGLRCDPNVGNTGP